MTESASIKTQEINSLTSLRGFAALWVLGLHISEFPNFSLPALNSILSIGYLGVDFFFTLSGFILSYAYIRSIETFKRIHYSKFLVFRLARIYPVHFMILILLLFKVLTGDKIAERIGAEGIQGVYNFLGHLFLVGSWFTNKDSWNAVAWTIHLEWLAYLLFPPFAGILIPKLKPLNKKIPIISLLLVFFVGLFSLLLFLSHTKTLNLIGSDGLIRILFEFPTGVLLYLLFTQLSLKTSALNDAIILVCGALTYYLYTNGFYTAAPLWFMGTTIFLTPKTKFLNPFLSIRILEWIGTCSYSLYLVHSLVIAIWKERLHSLFIQHAFAELILLFILNIIIAHFIYMGIEKPIRNLIRNKYQKKFPDTY